MVHCAEPALYRTCIVQNLQCAEPAVCRTCSVQNLQCVERPITPSNKGCLIEHEHLRTGAWGQREGSTPPDLKDQGQGGAKLPSLWSIDLIFPHFLLTFVLLSGSISCLRISWLAMKYNNGWEHMFVKSNPVQILTSLSCHNHCKCPFPNFCPSYPTIVLASLTSTLTLQILLAWLFKLLDLFHHL